MGTCACTRRSSALPLRRASKPSRRTGLRRLRLPSSRPGGCWPATARPSTALEPSGTGAGSSSWDDRSPPLSSPLSPPTLSPPPSLSSLRKLYPLAIDKRVVELSHRFMLQHHPAVALGRAQPAAVCLDPMIFECFDF